MSKLEHWKNTGSELGWKMPGQTWVKRLPFIRHARALIAIKRVYCWYEYGPGQFGISTGYDEWVVTGIWLGQERPLP